MDKYITQYLVKHNGKSYPAGSEIELEDASELLDAKAVKLITKANPDKNKNGSSAPAQNPQEKSNNGTEGEKGDGAGDENNPPQPKPYEFLKDAEQVEYLTNLSDEDFKTQFTEVLEKSKTQAKKFAKKRMNQIAENTGNGAEDKNGSAATDQNQESLSNTGAED